MMASLRRLLVVALLAVLSVLAGFLVSYPMKLVDIATTSITWWLQ